VSVDGDWPDQRHAVLLLLLLVVMMMQLIVDNLVMQTLSTTPNLRCEPHVSVTDVYTVGQQK